MRVLFVVHRYGTEVRGGAEGACRDLATRLAGRGHDVTVLTTRALNYRDWDHHYRAGEETIDGVRVVRLDNEHRDVEAFDRLNLRLARAPGPIAPQLQQAWIDTQGPVVPGLRPWIEDHADDHDVCVFMPYLYGTTTTGVPAAAGRIPTVLVPCLHPEPPLRIQAFDEVADLSDLVVFLTPEEATLYHERFRPRIPSLVAGLGVDATGAPSPDDWRDRLGIGDGPFVLYLGRIDPSKGTDWLATRFAQYKQERPGPLRLVMAGDPVAEPPTAPDVVLTGIVDDAARAALLRNAIALVHPSPFESFSLVLMESWTAGTPVLANGNNPVLRGHVERSAGGLLFEGGAELAACLDVITDDGGPADSLGAAGRRYVDANYRWGPVLDRWERLLRRARTATGP